MRKDANRQVRMLIRDECANYYGGACALADKPCMQFGELRKADGERIKLCSWFREAILPLDPARYAETTHSDIGGIVKSCAGCEKLILITSDRQRSCVKCGQINRKRVHAQTMRLSRRDGNGSKRDAFGKSESL